MPRAAETRRRVLDVAARQFRERGYAGVSLRGIAAEAGMKAGSLYYHFDSKEQIVVEVLDAGIELVYQAVSDAVSSRDENASAENVLRTAIREHLRAFLTYSDYTCANVRIFGQVPPKVREENLAARRRYEKLWDGIISELKSRGLLRQDIDVRSTRLFLLGAMNSTLEWFDPGRGKIDTLADKYLDLVLHGVIQTRRGTS